MDLKMKCRIGFGFEKPKSVHLWWLQSTVNLQRQSSTFKQTSSDGVSRLVSRPKFAILGLEGFRSRLGL